MRIDLLEFIGLVITGFTSCAEFGSYAFVGILKIFRLIGSKRAIGGNSFKGFAPGCC
jgi:hypothetical protein